MNQPQDTQAQDNAAAAGWTLIVAFLIWPKIIICAALIISVCISVTEKLNKRKGKQRA